MIDTRFRRRWVALLALCASACSFDLMEQAAVLENTCVNDMQCNGATCEGGMCVAATGAAFAITLQVTPASAAYGVEPPTIVLPEFALTTGSDRIVLVPDAAQVFGDVRVDGDTIAASLRFVPMTGSRAFSPRATVAKTSMPISVATDEIADYSAPLLQGTDYRVTIVPADLTVVPPLRLSLAGSDEAARRFDVTYDSDSFSSRKVQLADLPEGTWSIVAIDPVTAEEISTRPLVSTGTASVTLLSAEALDVFDVVVAPVGEPGVGGVLPTFRVAYDALVPDGSGILTLTLPTTARVVSFVGTIEPCLASSSASGETRPAVAVALRSRSLLATDSLVGFTASFATTATAEYDTSVHEWTFSAQIPEGQYDVVVTPAAESQCGVFAESRMIRAPSQGTDTTAALLQLPALSFLSGRVRTVVQAMPVAGASVAASALGLRDAIALEPDDDTVTRYNRSQQASSDMLGEFTLPVDVGAYDVVVKPPADTGFAWQVFHDVNVGARTDTPFDREINLPAPVVLRGVLQTPSDAPSMLGATVQAYTTVSDPERGQRALPIGSVVADGDGRFMLLLPASIEQGWY